MSRCLLLLSLLIFSCQNLEDAGVPERQTFIRFFGSPRSYSAAAAELDSDGGFIIVGNVAALDTVSKAYPESQPKIIVMKTDGQGAKIWETLIPNGIAHSVKVLPNGYLITGDGIELDPAFTEVSEFDNYQMRVILLDKNGNVDSKTYTKDSTVTVDRGSKTVDLKVDFHGFASTVLPSGDIATLGSLQVPGDFEKIITVGFSPNDISTPIWRKNFNLFGANYSGVRFLGLTTGSNNLIWASTAIPEDQNLVKYTSVITAPPNFASPSNNSLLGKDGAQSYDVNDMQPSHTGFAMVGTYSDRDGKKANVFFARVDQSGSIMTGTIRYFDALSGDGENGQFPGLEIDVTAESGESEDSGDAIVATKDGGFVLACSMAANPTRGNGGTDIILIKIDPTGVYQWDKLLGGSGDEKVSSIRELSDGSLLITGTETISNVSSIFIMKTDRNGDLRD